MTPAEYASIAIVLLGLALHGYMGRKGRQRGEQEREDASRGV